MKSLSHPSDPYGMNWIEGHTQWGTVTCPKGITVAKSSERSQDIITERYVFTNKTDKDIFTSLNSIGIYTPFNDDYIAGSKVCMTARCHTHIWCGENISYVMCLRMGGEAPHLGLVLTEGRLGGYSIERDTAQISNDRGDFILHPAPVTLAPGQHFTIAWTLFWHSGLKDFQEKLCLYNKHFIQVSAENYIVFKGESIAVSIRPFFAFKNALITRDKIPVSSKQDNAGLFLSEKAENPGQYSYEINIDGISTHCNILVLPELEILAEKRCHFICDNQQYQNPESRLDGAYLIYDNEEKHMYYHRANDYNGGRERIGMGLLIAKYLQAHRDKKLMDSLKKYISYVEKNLLCRETGEVFNDYAYNNSYHRLYNYPWMSLFYLELYTLFKDRELLETAYRIMLFFYRQGGDHFYAIEVPVMGLVTALKECHMDREADTAISWFRKHADYIAETGLDYPAHEVKYEQSIVAPAANILLQTFLITNESIYLDAAKKQLDVLEMFNGFQPDYHLYETAIRHWDGYWFGKRKAYGDTFPHYWSALTANAFLDFARITGSREYLQRAKQAYRSVLSLIHPDGSASCAYVYPVSVNGAATGFYDPYANDQDWGLYFALRSCISESSLYTTFPSMIV